MYLLTAFQSCSSIFSLPIAANENGKNVGSVLANLHVGIMSNSLNAHAEGATPQSACHCNVIDLRCTQINSLCDHMLLPSLLVRAVMNATELFDSPGPELVRQQLTGMLTRCMTCMEDTKQECICTKDVTADTTDKTKLAE